MRGNEVRSGVPRRRCQRLLALLLLVLSDQSAAVPSGEDGIARHPRELQALQKPEAVLQMLPAEIAAAEKLADHRSVALLYLAKANACRVVANWACQLDAGHAARAAADRAHDPALAVRGLIAEARGGMALQHFSRAKEILSEAESILTRTPAPALLGDVHLAYSSMSYTLGKHALARDYASRGLAALGDQQQPAVRARLLRNRGRAEAELGDVKGAQATLQAARAVSDAMNDPKLSAELDLELARIARIEGDIPAQRASGERVLQLAQTFGNPQLRALGHEVLGLATRSAGELDDAEHALRAADAGFREAGLESEQRRVLRELIRVMLEREPARQDLGPLLLRLMTLDERVDQRDRALAGDDFEARLRYAEQDFELQRLAKEAELAGEREKSLSASNRQRLLLLAVGALGLAVIGGFLALQRRANGRLARAYTRLQEGEGRYRTLAEHSRDLVVRMRLDGRSLYVSPSVRELLGRGPEQIAELRIDMVHPDDRAAIVAARLALARLGDTVTVSCRALHSDGHYVWIEAAAVRVPGQVAGGEDEIAYSGRDISARVAAETALQASEKRLRAVTDNIPAIISHVDRDERYTFANAFMGRMFGVDERSVIGRSVREVRGEKIYESLAPHVASVLAGEAVNFEGTAEFSGRTYHYQTSYIPDHDLDGTPRGFFAMTFDITKLKLAEQLLEREARFDALTGVANRRYFGERLALAAARSRRQHAPIALLYLDIDRFKAINDLLGHAAGDEVISEFARRLQACVREDDLVARIGGDEFVVLIEFAESAEVAEHIAGKLIEAMQPDMLAAGESLHVTISIGVAFANDANQADSLLAQADRALYAAKAAGRNTWRRIDEP